MHLLEVILVTFISLDLLVWRQLHIVLFPARDHRRWDIALAVLMLGVIGFTGCTMFANGYIAGTHTILPRWIPATVYIWQFLILPITLVLLFGHSFIRFIQRRIRRQPAAPPQQPDSSPLWSRRHFLAATALTVPPAVSLGLGIFSKYQMDEPPRVRRYDLALPGLHRDLDGFTIAVVADVHTGVFSTPRMLNTIADITNNLRAELVLLAGDLVNISHGDLPGALDMVRKLDSPNGLYMVQGNHDCVQGPDTFDEICQSRGVPVLVDEIQTLKLRGVPVQLLGTRWTPNDKDINRYVTDLAESRDKSIFSILMTHHPHGWDSAEKSGIPLVIAGHTHGGQIMLTENIGAGPLRFRYWSGLYERNNNKLVVSNGVGNWFPIRINAPTEIVHITLHPQSA